MKFQDILVGSTPRAQAELDIFFSELGEEKILWYPSAGKDYRDVLEVTASRLHQHGIEEAPNIICHTDYFSEWLGLDDEILHKDQHTTVRLTSKYQLSIHPGIEIKYFISSEHASFYDKAPSKPTIYLLKINISSDRLGNVDAHVFFFLFENYNFLEQIVIKHGLKITHFIKIREGCGFGGNRKSITAIYSLLGNLGVKWLIVDGEIHYCSMTHDRISRDFHIFPQRFSLQPIGSELHWSGYYTRAFKVISENGYLTKKDLISNLEKIAIPEIPKDWSGQSLNEKNFSHRREYISTQIENECRNVKQIFSE